ncbi:MAG TPA: nuclear transport factor 2 family protein [Candidatus Dormibacteraeota bacterium]
MAEAGTKLSTQQKVERVRQAFDAFERGDLQTVGDAFTEDAVWHGRGSTKFGADFKGKQATMANIMEYAQTFQDIKQDIHDILASDSHVAALVTATVSRNGKTFKDQQVFLFHVNDAGKVTEAWIVSDTEQLKASLES